MLKKKILISILIAAAVVLFFIIYVLNFTGLFRTPSIGFYKTERENYSLVLNMLKDPESGFGKDPEIHIFNSEGNLLDQFTNSPVDILITENIVLDDDWSRMLLPIDNQALEIYPKSTRAFSIYNGKYLQLPLQLDHIEFAYKKKDITGAPDSGLIFSLTELESQLLDLRKAGHYPLMIAGHDDRDLLDAVSVLTLSLAGVEGYRSLMNLFYSGNSFKELLDKPLRGELTFADILEKIQNWRDSGIIHPEWLRFTREEVVKFLEDGISSACIMRLSTHRTLNSKLLDQLGETPFPFLERKDRATGLVMPGYSAVFYLNSKFSGKMGEIIRSMVSNETQSDLTASSGLAPMTSVSEAIDKQASNVRLWGAASREILPPLPFPGDTNMSELRNYLQFR